MNGADPARAGRSVVDWLFRPASATIGCQMQIGSCGVSTGRRDARKVSIANLTTRPFLGGRGANRPFWSLEGMVQMPPPPGSASESVSAGGSVTADRPPTPLSCVCVCVYLCHQSIKGQHAPPPVTSAHLSVFHQGRTDFRPQSPGLQRSSGDDDLLL